MARPRKKQRRDEGPKGPVGTTTALHTSARNGDAEAISRMLAEFKEKSCEQEALAVLMDSRLTIVRHRRFR